jgi:cyclase
MRTSLALAIVAVFALLTVSTWSAQQAQRQDVEILTLGPTRTEKVKDNLYVIRGPFLACGTRGCRPNGPDDGLIHEPGDVAVRVTPEGAILVDDKYPENLSDVLAQVRSVTPLPIRYMLNSHHHGDHVSGNANVRAMGIDVIAHRNIRENFLKIKQPGEPNIVFADYGAVYLGGVEVQLHYLGRGHTSGDTVTYFPDLRTIHMGDLVIDGMPVIDYSGGGSAIEFVKTIERMLALDFDTAIPGHGHVMTRAEVQAYKIRFETMNRRMRELVKKGVPKEQLKTLAQIRAQLRLADLGWDNSVSTTASINSFSQYYDEIAAAP